MPQLWLPFALLMVVLLAACGSPGVPVPLHKTAASPPPVAPINGVAYEPTAAVLIQPGSEAEVIPNLVIRVDRATPYPVWVNGGAIREVIAINGTLKTKVVIEILPPGQFKDAVDQPDGSILSGIEMQNPLFMGAALLANVLLGTGMDVAPATYAAGADNYALACAPDIIYERIHEAVPQLPKLDDYQGHRDYLCGREYAIAGVMPDGWVYGPLPSR